MSLGFFSIVFSTLSFQSFDHCWFNLTLSHWYDQLLFWWRTNLVWNVLLNPGKTKFFLPIGWKPIKMRLPFLTLLCHQPVANFISLQVARRISVLFGAQPGKPPAAAQNQFFNVYQICERGTCSWCRVLGNLSLGDWHTGVWLPWDVEKRKEKKETRRKPRKMNWWLMTTFWFDALNHASIISLMFRKPKRKI